MVRGISVVIPNYNGVKLFAHTLPTVEEALLRTGLPTEVLVVDDFSTDGSVEYLQKHFPDVKVIAKKQNDGFSVTANVGIKAATFDKVLLLNSDVQLTPSYFQHQLSYFDKPDTFGVMGRIVGWEDDIIQDGAKLPTFHGAKIKTSANYLVQNEADMAQGLFTMYLSGANAFLDREKFLLLHGFNELFSPFYSEDVDLSLRAWRLGFTCYFDYASICRHQVSTSIRSKAKKEYVKSIYDRNKLFLNAIHLEGTARLLWHLQLIPEVLSKLLLLKGYYFRSFKMFLQAQPEVRKARHQFNALATQVGTRKTVQTVAQFILSHIPGKKVRL
jgi:GT2 family glycosyltransferase